MGVDPGGLTFLMENMGKDCTYLQMIRELTQNAVEAVLRGEYENGVVIWDVLPGSENSLGAPKLCIYDTGKGMSDEEIRKYINTFSASGGNQSFTKNFGIGGKVAAGTKNKAGVVYETWKEGNDLKGKMARLWKDPIRGRYGLKSWDDTGMVFFADVPPDRIPDEIKKAGHGTRVTLLGDDENENTVMPKDSSVKGGTRWLIQYLNTRYYEFPKRVQVKAREAFESEHSQTRTVRGMKKELEDIKQSSGDLIVEGGIIRWWILDKAKVEKKRNSLALNSGHIATLYQGELYGLLRGPAGKSMLQQFGVTVGTNRVVIYVEPNDPGMVADIARSELKKDGDRFPWEIYAEQFSNKRPKEIVALIEEELSKLEVGHTNIMKMWQKMKDWFDFPSYRKVSSGSVNIQPGGNSIGADGEADTGSAEPEEGTESKTRKATRSASKSRVDSFLRGRVDSSEVGEPTSQVCFPKVSWTDTPEEHQIEDRAASYIQPSHLIIANSKFRGFTWIVDQVLRDFDHEPMAKSLAVQLVKSEYELVFHQTVLGLTSLKDTSSGKWDADALAKALSPEALTAAVMSRLYQVQQVKRALNTEIAKQKMRSSTDESGPAQLKLESSRA
jgi:hypothetical protein